MSLVKKIRNWAIGIGIATVIATPVYSFYFPDTIRTKINETQVKRYHNKDKYLIFTDSGVFENTDAWYRLKFRSSNLQAELMKLKGKEVEIKKYGWRIPIISGYENILKVKEIPQPSIE
jgi:hypothetical protein